MDVFNTLAPRFVHELLDTMIGREDFERHGTLVDLNDEQRAIVWRDGRVAMLLGPGRHAFWRGVARLHVETFDVRALRFEHPQLEAVVALPDAGKWLDGVHVDAHEEVLLFSDGILVERLAPGRHVFWKGAGRIAWKQIDRREQVADIGGQEILSADKVTLRVNLVVVYQVIDAVKAVTVVADAAQALYREAQLVLRAAVGARTLDALLADKAVVGAELQQALADRAAEFGVAIRSVGLRDIILPGEVREILNRVIAAEKQAQANLIRRREETAAARSQANTARLLAESPILARMKELEVLQEILAGAKATFVLGNGDLARQIAGLIGKEVHGADTS
jgi:regulator of protease activity HflC (stomatin/prohibitin superfamily)